MKKDKSKRSHIISRNVQKRQFIEAGSRLVAVWELDWGWEWGRGTRSLFGVKGLY